MRPLPACPAKLSHQRDKESYHKHLSPNHVLQVTRIQLGTTMNISGPSMNGNKFAFWLEAVSLYTFIF